MQNYKTTVPAAPQFTLPNNGNLQPMPTASMTSMTSMTSMIGVWLLLGVLGVLPSILHEIPPLIRVLKGKPKTPGKK